MLNKIVLVAAVAVAVAAGLRLEPPQKPVGQRLGSQTLCEACDWVVDHVFAHVTNDTNCAEIDQNVTAKCAEAGSTAAAVCDWIVKKICPKVINWLHQNSSSVSVCERIGFCAGADSECHSFGKLADNGRCTETLATNSTTEWRLEWNALPWWKNKGCNPPRHIGLTKEYCTTSNIGCCLSGYTPHA